MSNAAQIGTTGGIETISSEDVVASESRWSARRRTHLAGVLSAEGQASQVSCIVSDSSSTGAKLEVDPRRRSGDYAFASLPQRFWLFIKLDRTRVLCEVVWRAGARMGVRFVSPMQNVPRATTRPIKQRQSESKSKFGWPFRKAK